MSLTLVNWREIPFVRLCLPLLGGILSAAWAPVEMQEAFLLGGLLALASVAILLIGARRLPYARRWVFGLVLNLVLFALGRLLGFLSDERRAQDHFSAQLLETNIVSAQVLQVQPRGERLRLVLSVNGIGRPDGELQAARGRLMAYVPVDAEARQIGVGAALLFRAAVLPVQGPKNPKAFDYRGYLHRKDIHYQCFIQEGEWRFGARPAATTLGRYTDAARQYCIGVLRRHLPTPNEFGVATALVLGYRDETPESLRDAYAATGATHVLAVSGLHVGIVQMVITFLLQFWGGKGREHRLPKMGITLVGVWGFALITGAPSSALRAATMFSFLTVGRALRRPANIYNAIAASAFFLLCLNPRLLFDVGFQLSYLAVIGIVFFHPRIYKLWYIENRLGDKLWQLAALSLAATLTTFPLSLLYFHQFPMYFWLSGLVAVPAAGVILSLGLLLFAVQGIPFLGAAVGKLMWAVIWGMNAVIFFIQQLPGSRISGIWIGAGTALLLYGIIGAIALAVTARKFRWVFAALSLGVLVAAIGFWEQWKAHQRQEIVLYHTRRQTVLDVFDGKQVFTLSAQPVSEEDKRFALLNYRWYCRSRPAGAWLLDESPPVQERWYYRNGLLGFQDLRMAVASGGSALPKAGAVELRTDFLLLRDNPRASIEELVSGWNLAPAGAILIDASNSRGRVRRWMAECETLGLHCYDVEQMGAWVFDLKKNR